MPSRLLVRQRETRWRSLVRGDGDAEQQRLGAEIQSPIGLVAVQETAELEDAVLVGALFDAQKTAALIRRGGTKIDAGIEAGHQKLVVVELGNQGAPHELGITRRTAVPRPNSIGHGGVPCSEAERLRE